MNIGDIAILIESKLYPEDVGEECVIVGVNVEDLLGEPKDYAIRFNNIPDHPISGHWTVFEYQLRKKYDGNEPSTWEEVQNLTNWSPCTIETDREPVTGTISSNRSTRKGKKIGS